MRKIRIIEHISLDGVIQSGGGPDEDRDGGFEHGGWAVPYADPAAKEDILAAQGKGFDLLLGRRTYDIWSGYWPKVTGTFADDFNAAIKFVATHRPESLAWGPAQGVGGDVVEDVRRVKSKGGGDLIVWGSSTLTPVLLEAGLVDEVMLLVYPVLLGTGKQFFSAAAPTALALVSTKRVPSGIVISTYRPDGPLRTGSFAKAAG